MRSFVAALVALPSLLVAASPLVNIGTIHKDAAPVISSQDAVEVPDAYLVVFKPHVRPSDAAQHHEWVQDMHMQTQMELRKRSFPLSDAVFEGLRHTFHISDGLMGYSGHFDESAIERIRRHPDVAFIEKDSVVRVQDEPETRDQAHETERNAPWGLARISHRESLGFGNFNKYLYAGDGGAGVDVYVIDTGTNTAHVDFEGRAKWGKTIPVDDPDEDGNGHGTHCSGTIAGKKYGVAKKANIKAVKVLRSNGSGTMADVVKGVEYAVTAHKKQVEQAAKGKRKGFKGSAANMSLGGGKSAILDMAVNAAVDAGIHFAVAAGNDNADACRYSPAAAEKAVTVGASTMLDERASFSNYGQCTDIFAPGLNILSTWIGSEYAVNTISGTSMASPHIAGLLAYMLSLQPSKDSAFATADLTPKKLKSHLVTIATQDALTNMPGETKNLLAWNGGGSSNYSGIIDDGGYSLGGGASQGADDSTALTALIETKLSEMSKAIERADREMELFIGEEMKKVEQMLDDTEYLLR